MLVVFPPIFVADTKLIDGNNFVAPLILVWIGYYWSRLVNIGLDGLNIKKYWLILVTIGQYWLKCWSSLTDIKRYLDRIILTKHWLILTNYWLSITKSEYALV